MGIRVIPVKISSPDGISDVITMIEIHEISGSTMAVLGTPVSSSLAETLRKDAVEIHIIVKKSRTQ